ncbi:MAG: hypothetical protein IKT41_01705 [Clostridia bacterium]|nr:hypothetical protein [Clostridia bacterium]
MEEQKYFTIQEVIQKYSPMFTMWSLSKLIREKKIKTISIGRRKFISKDAVEAFIAKQEENSIKNERGDLYCV